MLVDKMPTYNEFAGSTTNKKPARRPAFREADEGMLDEFIQRLKSLPKAVQPKQVRIPLLLSEKAADALSELAGFLNTNRSDVLRIGFSLLMRGVKAETEGLRLVLVDEEDRIVERLTWS